MATTFIRSSGCLALSIQTVKHPSSYPPEAIAHIYTILPASSHPVSNRYSCSHPRLPTANTYSTAQTGNLLPKKKLIPRPHTRRHLSMPTLALTPWR